MLTNTLSKYTRIAMLMSVTVALAGCSGEPSEGDIESVLNAQNAQMAEQMSSLLGKDAMKDMKTEIHSVKKINCAQTDATYICDIELDATLPMVGRNKQATKVAMIKGSDGWMMAQ